MFKTRLSKPTKKDKYYKCYLRKASGGWSPCIQGKPKDTLDVLANCVGYAIGRFNEIYNEVTGNDNMKYAFTVSPKSFITKAKTLGLQTGTEPMPGCIMVWEGHVAIAEEVTDKVLCSESAYNGKTFYTKTRSGKNYGRSDKFMGVVYNPAMEVFMNCQPVERDETKNQLLEKSSNLRVRSTPNLKGKVLGYLKANVYYDYFDTVEADGYTWYELATGEWCAKTSTMEVFPVQIDALKEQIEELNKQVARMDDIIQELNDKINKAIEALQ